MRLRRKAAVAIRSDPSVKTKFVVTNTLIVATGPSLDEILSLGAPIRDIVLRSIQCHLNRSGLIGWLRDRLR
jgi:hypothetical protein